MANRYWVGTGSWTSTNTANWSANSNGSPTGASVPGISDDVFFNATAGSGNCTTSSATQISCKSLDTTGYTGTITHGSGKWNVFGNCRIDQTSHYIGGAGAGIFNLNGAAGVTSTVYVAPVSGTNCSFGSLYINGYTNSTYTMLSNLVSSGGCNYGGTLNMNGYSFTLTSSSAQMFSSATSTVNMASGSVLSASSFDLISTIINGSSGSKIVITNIASGFPAGLSLAPTSTVDTLELHPNNSTPIVVGLNSTAPFNITNLTSIDDGVSAGTIHVYPGGGTWNIKNISIKGSATRLHTVTVPSGTTPFTILSDNGKIDCNYMTLSYSNGTGSSTYYAGKNSTLSNTTGWILQNWVPKSGNALMFGDSF